MNKSAPIEPSAEVPGDVKLNCKVDNTARESFQHAGRHVSLVTKSLTYVSFSLVAPFMYVLVH